MTEIIDNRGHLIEVAERVTQIQISLPGGMNTTQRRVNHSFKDKGKATGEDHRRISRALGESA